MSTMPWDRYAAQSSPASGQMPWEKYGGQPDTAANLTPATPTGPQQTIEPPEARNFSNYASEALGGLGTGLKNSAVGAFQAVRHPIDTAVGMEKQVFDQAIPAAQKEFKETEGADLPSRVIAAGLSGAEKLPIVGEPIAKAAGAGIGSPESVGAASELATYAAVPKLAEKGLQSVPAVSRFVANPRETAMEDPNAAALKGLGVGPKSKFAQRAIQSTEGARPYLQGAQNLQDIQSKIPAAKAEVWGPYQDTINAIGGKSVTGPDGPTTIGDLEKQRLELSALNRGLKNGDPASLQLAQQKGLSQADALAKEKAVQNALDPHLENAGIDPKLIRKTFGQISDVGSRVAGRSTLAEPSTRFGLGRAANLSIKNPLAAPEEVIGGVRDIVAGRPLFRGKATDVAIREGFRRGGAKPDLGSFDPQSQVAPENRQLPAPGIPDAEYTMGGEGSPARPSPAPAPPTPSVITPAPDAVPQLPAQASPDSTGAATVQPSNPPPPLNAGTASTRTRPPLPPNPQPTPAGRATVTPEGVAIPERKLLPAPSPKTNQTLKVGDEVTVKGRTGEVAGMNPKTGKVIIKWHQ